MGTLPKMESEQQLAYVYVVQLSQHMATQVWVQRFFDNIKKQLDTPIPEGEFEFWHAISLIIEDAIKGQEGVFEKLDSTGKLIEQLIESFNNSYLSNEQQAKLPRQAILFYQRYEYYLKRVIGTLQVFKIATTDEKVFKLIDASQIYNSIDTVNSFFKAAGLLRSAMIEFGSLGQAESSQILIKQYEIFDKNVNEQLGLASKLEKAREFLIKEGVLNANK